VSKHYNLTEKQYDLLHDFATKRGFAMLFWSSQQTATYNALNALAQYAEQVKTLGLMVHDLTGQRTELLGVLEQRNIEVGQHHHEAGELADRLQKAEQDRAELLKTLEEMLAANSNAEAECNKIIEGMDIVKTERDELKGRLAAVELSNDNRRLALARIHDIVLGAKKND
jgi:chromosome segregation ATPase